MRSENSSSVADYVSGIVLLPSHRLLPPHAGYTPHVQEAWEDTRPGVLDT